MANSFEADRRRTFGKHEVAPLACVIDSKHHLQTILSDALENIGFVVCSCSVDRSNEPHAAQALDAGWLELWYQPKPTPKRLDGAEAPIRMRHPN